MKYTYNLGKYFILLIFIAVIVVSGRFSGLAYGPGVVFILLGVAAMAFMSFTLDEMKSAFKDAANRTGDIQTLQKSTYFWEVMARNAWILGVLGSVINFVLAIFTSDSRINVVSLRVSKSFLTTLYGLILGIVCFILALKLKQKLQQIDQPGSENKSDLQELKTKKSFQIESVFGYLLFLSILIWSYVSPIIKQTLRGQFAPVDMIVYWPAVLVVIGGTIVLVLFIGKTTSGLPFTLGFVLPGLIGSLAGFVQVLLAFSLGIIQDIAAAMNFIISSCFLVLLGMILIGNPLEDKVVKAQKKIKPSMLSRLAWYVFPLLTIIFLVITFILIVTPVRK